MSANKLELIESVEVTSSTATVTLGGANWNNTYDSYMVILDGVTNDSADEIQMHLLDSANAEIINNKGRLGSINIKSDCLIK